MLSIRQSVRLILVIAVTLHFSFTGCQKKSGLEAPGNENEAQAKTEKKSSGVADAIRSQTDLGNKFDEPISLPDDIDELMLFLARQQSAQTRVKTETGSYKVQRARAAASAKLLAMKVNREQQFEFIKIRIDSLLKLMSAGDPQAKLDFQKVVTKYGNDKQPRIRQAVAIGGLIYDFRLVAAQSENEPDSTVAPRMTPIMEAAGKIIAEHPASFDVCKEIGAIADQLLQQGHRDSWSELARILISGYKDSENKTCRNFVSRLAGRVNAANTKLDLIVEEIRQKNPEASGKYRQAVNYLLSEPSVDVASVQPIVGSLQWLENTGMHVETLEANRIVLAASVQVTNEKVRDQLRLNCEKREVRLSLIGQPFSISALTQSGERLDWASYSKDNAVIVVFWSPSEPASVKLVQDLAGIQNRFKEANLKLLAVSLVDNGNLSSSFDSEPVVWQIAKANPDSSLIDTFGIAGTPHMIMVKADGMVFEVNPPATLIDQKIIGLMK